ncbi:MAG: HDOD domain-containing protein [Gammaproteobacteria bacterium SHHR-1]|uniref:HDOD domain-containing protein n=1 Tax=Magnetovirga frankeli TaxID=947516 RepID=UPI001293F4E6|nr:HDOD domain-containing protein [gamma proteobacterium SS-5]
MPKSLDQWIAHISDQEMPIFGKTVQAIVSVAEDDLASASKLAKVVLQDASLTAKVLKLVNSIYYNPARAPISTVSRAVVVMGFSTIRNICLSIGLVDSVVTGPAKDQLTKELARAIHSAVQAREMALLMDDKEPEEVFVASLLHNIGDLAFWCHSGKQGESILKLLEQPEYDPELAQKEVLGFELNQLSLGLVKEWGINQLLEETLEHPEKAQRRGKSVILAHELAQASEQHGWNSDEVKKVVKQAAKITLEKEEHLLAEMKNNAREAASIAGIYGAANAAKAIPLPDKEKLEKPAEEPKVSDFPEPDPLLQLRILRELSQIAEKKADFNLIVEMVMEGVHRGVGFDRTLFSLATPDRNTIYGKFSLGRSSLSFTESFRFNRTTDPSNIFFRILDKKAELWVDLAKNPALKAMYTPKVQQVIGLKPFFASCIMVNGKSIGIIYADRSLSGRSLDEEAFSSFKHFSSETGMILAQRLGIK